jgi:hypothetical protein
MDQRVVSSRPDQLSAHDICFFPFCKYSATCSAHFMTPHTATMRSPRSSEASTPVHCTRVAYLCTKTIATATLHNPDIFTCMTADT